MLYNADVTLTLALAVEADDHQRADAAARERARGAAPSAEISSVLVYPRTVTEQLQADNLHAVQELMALDAAGTSGQKARWFRHLLPEDELLDLARAELFKPFATMARRHKILHTDIRHTPFCGRSIPADAVAWHTDPYPALNAAQWRNLESAERASAEVRQHPWMSPKDACHVETREHRGVCSRCDRAASQIAVLVTISWAGRRDISREYLL